MSLVSGNVLVTGATGGIGHAIARAFAARGASLLLTGRRVAVLEALAAETSGRAIPCDLADRGDVERLAVAANEAALDVLIANAGLPGSGQLTDWTVEQVDRLLDVNLRAPVLLAHEIAPGMIERGRGHIVFVSSLQGIATTPGAPLYCATKFALRGLALALREDFRAHNVGVSVVLPGFIRDAGMYAEVGVRLPPGIGTRSPDQVAAGVIRAIERNRAEVEVAPVALRFGAALAGLAPEIAAGASRLMGSERIAAAYEVAQRDKRS